MAKFLWEPIGPVKNFYHNFLHKFCEWRREKRIVNSPKLSQKWAFEEEKTSQSCNLIRNETQRVSSFIFVFAASSHVEDNDDDDDDDSVDDNDDSDGDDDDGDDGDTFYRFRKTPTTQH